MLKSIITLFFSILFAMSWSQQWVELTQQHSYEMYLNPSLAGSRSAVIGTIAHRSQYVGLGGKAISTQHLGFSSPIFTNKFGIGVKFVNDQIGYQRFTIGEFALAYHASIKKSEISFGASGGFVQLGIDGSLLRAADGNYTSGTVVHNDEFLPNTKTAGFSPTVSSGITFKTGNFTVGAAAQNILSPKIIFDSSISETYTQINRTINVHSSYVIQLNKIRL